MPLALRYALLNEGLIFQRGGRCLPLMPLAVAVKARGHDVRLAIAAAFAASGQVFGSELEAARVGKADAVPGCKLFRGS